MKDGDSFIGRSGAILKGSKVLTGWNQVTIKGVSYWTTQGGRPLPTPLCSAGTSAPSCCEAGYPGCVYVQDVYVNNVEYQHVTSLANIVAGQSWYYDFSGTDGGVLNNIYLAAGHDPNSDTVELGDTTFAFSGSASNITIDNLTVEKYAAPIELGAIVVTGPYWLIQQNEILLNHGEGITDLLGGDHIQVLNNNVHNNGETGLQGPGSYGLWDSNIIAYNNADHIDPNYEGNGTKWEGHNVTISNSVSHDNNGMGLFCDAGATYCTITNNVVYTNLAGIRYETGQYGVIKNDIVYNNCCQGLAEITYAGSDHGRITGNTVVSAGPGGAIEVENIVGTRPHSIVYKVTDVQVTSNTMWIPSQGYDQAGLFDYAQPPEPSIYQDPTNFFNYNIYEFGQLQRPIWVWGETGSPPQVVDWYAWHVTGGQDPNGNWVQNVPPPAHLPQ